MPISIQEETVLRKQLVFVFLFFMGHFLTKFVFLSEGLVSS